MEYAIETPEQISAAAFAASENARTAEQHIAAAELHRIASEQGEARYRAGHALAITREKLAARAKQNSGLARQMYRAQMNAAQVGR